MSHAVLISSYEVINDQSVFDKVSYNTGKSAFRKLKQLLHFVEKFFYGSQR